VPEKFEAEAELANCSALINQINAGLSAEEPFVDISSAIELLFCLERAASALIHADLIASRRVRVIGRMLAANASR
jgi:hypothetical protein